MMKTLREEIHDLTHMRSHIKEEKVKGEITENAYYILDNKVRQTMRNIMSLAIDGEYFYHTRGPNKGKRIPIPPRHREDDDEDGKEDKQKKGKEGGKGKAKRKRQEEGESSNQVVKDPVMRDPAERDRGVRDSASSDSSIGPYYSTSSTRPGNRPSNASEKRSSESRRNSPARSNDSSIERPVAPVTPIPKNQPKSVVVKQTERRNDENIAEGVTVTTPISQDEETGDEEIENLNDSLMGNMDTRDIDAEDHTVHAMHVDDDDNNGEPKDDDKRDDDDDDDDDDKSERSWDHRRRKPKSRSDMTESAPAGLDRHASSHAAPSTTANQIQEGSNSRYTESARQFQSRRNQDEYDRQRRIEDFQNQQFHHQQQNNQHRHQQQIQQQTIGDRLTDIANDSKKLTSEELRKLMIARQKEEKEEEEEKERKKRRNQEGGCDDRRDFYRRNDRQDDGEGDNNAGRYFNHGRGDGNRGVTGSGGRGASGSGGRGRQNSFN